MATTKIESCTFCAGTVLLSDLSDVDFRRECLNKFIKDQIGVFSKITNDLLMTKMTQQVSSYSSDVFVCTSTSVYDKLDKERLHKPDSVIKIDKLHNHFHDYALENPLLRAAIELSLGVNCPNDLLCLFCDTFVQHLEGGSVKIIDQYTMQRSSAYIKGRIPKRKNAIFFPSESYDVRIHRVKFSTRLEDLIERYEFTLPVTSEEFVLQVGREETGLFQSVGDAIEVPGVLKELLVSLLNQMPTMSSATNKLDALLTKISEAVDSLDDFSFGGFVSIPPLYFQKYSVDP